MRLLLVEDNDRLAGFVGKGLLDSGFALDRVGNLADADSALAAGQFDAIVLDLGLPDGDGIDWLRVRRAAGLQLPVLMLTARGSTPEKVAGLNAGADDYLAKPFEMSELVARLKALLRRPGGALSLNLEVANIVFDTVHRDAAIAGKRLILSRSELILLELLMRKAGRVVQRRTLEEGLYGFDDIVGPNSLEAHMSRLRRKLEGAGATARVHTLRGVGYMLGEPGA